jgi:hypothetical protein
MPTIHALSLESVVVRGGEHVETEIGGQVFMMHLDQGKYFALEGIGRRIWSLVGTPISLASVVQTLSDEYEVDVGQCRSEVLAFAENLLRNGLIVPARD